MYTGFQRFSMNVCVLSRGNCVFAEVSLRVDLRMERILRVCIQDFKGLAWKCVIWRGLSWKADVRRVCLCACVNNKVCMCTWYDVMWCVMCDVWCVMRDVWCVMCDVWCDEMRCDVMWRDVMRRWWEGGRRLGWRVKREPTHRRVVGKTSPHWPKSAGGGNLSKYSSLFAFIFFSYIFRLWIVPFRPFWALGVC